MSKKVLKTLEKNNPIRKWENDISIKDNQIINKYKKLNAGENKFKLTLYTYQHQILSGSSKAIIHLYYCQQYKKAKPVQKVS